jgi:hypothetical protein
MKLACKLIAFEFSFNMFEAKPAADLYNSVKKFDFKDEALGKVTCLSHYLFSDAALTARNLLCLHVDGYIVKMTIPDGLLPVAALPTANQQIAKIGQQQQQKPAPFLYLELNEIVGALSFGYGVLVRAPLNASMVAAGGFDGAVSLRPCADLKASVECQGAHYLCGGVKRLAWHVAGQGLSLIVLGVDGLLTFVNWK